MKMMQIHFSFILILFILSSAAYSSELASKSSVELPKTTKSSPQTPIDHSWPKHFYRLEGLISLQRSHLTANELFAIDFIFLGIKASQEFSLKRSWSTNTSLNLLFGEGTDANLNHDVKLSKANQFGARLLQSLGKRIYLKQVYFRPYVGAGLGLGKLHMQAKKNAQPIEQNNSYTEAIAHIGVELVGQNRMLFSFQFEHTRQFYRDNAQTIGLQGQNLRGYSNALKTSLGYLF